MKRALIFGLTIITLALVALGQTKNTPRSKDKSEEPGPPPPSASVNP